MLTAIIFDYDGTLAPTYTRQEKWFKLYCQENQKEWPFQDFDAFLTEYNKECSLSGGVQNFYNKLNLPCNMTDRKHPVWNAYLKFNQENPQEMYPNILETIQEIWKIGQLDKSRNTRLRIAINSNNLWSSIKKDLDSFGILPYVDTQVTADTLLQYSNTENINSLLKPSSFSVSLCLKLLQSPAQQTIHVGDTLNDLIASQKVAQHPHPSASLITVGAGYGYEGRRELEKGLENGIKFDYLIDKPSELIEIVRKEINR